MNSTRILVILITLSLFIVGCTNESDEVSDDYDTAFLTKERWELSPTFSISHGREMVGYEGKLGLLGGPLVENEISKHMWHFWGEGLRDKRLSVIAQHELTGGEINPLVNSGFELLAGENNGADYHLPSHMTFPFAGMWRLDVYLDDELFDSLVVQVEEE